MRVIKSTKVGLTLLLIAVAGAGCMRMESSLSKAELAEIEKRAEALYTPSPPAECRRMPLRQNLPTKAASTESSGSEELYDLVRGISRFGAQIGRRLRQFPGRSLYDFYQPA